MPFVRISLLKGKSPEHIRAIADGVHQGLIEAYKIPPDDRFQVVQQHERDEFIYDPDYLGIHRTDDLIIIQITFNEGRTTEQKKALYKAIAEGLQAAVGLRLEDVLINLVEVKKENWSFGNGVAQYAV